MLIISRSYFYSCFYWRTFASTKFLRTLKSSRKMELSASKPPNVLVYTGNENFQSIAKNLYKCLHADKYVIYELKQNQVEKTPWKENVALLVVFSDNLDNDIVKEFVHYATQGGKLLVICSDFKSSFVSCTTTEEKFMKVKYQNVEEVFYQGKYLYAAENSYPLAKNEHNDEVILKIDVEKGILITSSIHLLLEPSAISSASKEASSYSYFDGNLSILKSLLNEHFDLEGYVSHSPTPTPGYIIVDNEAELKNKMKLLNMSEIPIEKSTKVPKDVNIATESKVPLLSSYENRKISLFDKECYYKCLKTDYFGQTVVFFPVVTSTMIPAEHLSEFPGLVVIANRQLTGKGRGENIWISPEGSAAFTLHIPLDFTSKLGQRLSVLQHMASLAVVHGLRRKPGYEDLDFHLKWPNDIYYGRDKKMGGVLVNTTIQGKVVHVYVGIGVNISNCRPTVCVNSAIESYNLANKKSLAPVKVEEVIAITLSELENLVKEFTSSGPEQFLKLYYSYWLHKEQSVTLSDSNVKAVVKSIDEYGFLIVETEHGKKLTLQPDGNRFDIMKNLIIAKEL